MTITDANVFLGRVIPHYFPKIFGPNENEPIDVIAPKEAFGRLANEIGAGKSAEEVALGFIHVANESMCQPIRNLTTLRGFNLTDFAMACFGGAGPQHACAMARALGIKRILIHKHAGVLSALGLMAADLVCERQQPVAETLSDAEALPRLINQLNVLQESATEELVMQGCLSALISCERFLHMRFESTDTALMISEKDAADVGGFRKAFEANYKREFGFVLHEHCVLVDDIRIRAHGGSTIDVNGTNRRKLPNTSPPCPADWTMCYWEELQWTKTPIFSMDDHSGISETLKPGHHVKGPCIILQGVSTVVVEPDCTATISDGGNLEISVGSYSKRNEGPVDQLDPIYLSLFSNRFMGIAEQMGRTLQRTSKSVNIKERLDYSCALFDARGGLVANAPHVPVHLGSMQEAVRFQIGYWSMNNANGGGEELSCGDVILSNHPQLAGGSHLPDMTVITPVFVEKDIKFFVASRGHHADIGGIVPGSMPPFSKCLEEEGVAIIAFKIVKNGDYQEEAVNELMKCSRKLSDNVSDLKAQIAANTRGVGLVRSLIEEFSMDVVTAYMGHIQDNAEQAVRNLLRKFGLSRISSTDKGDRVIAEAEDYLDDGSPIHLRVELNIEDGSALFDFTGTGVQLWGNMNAPLSVTTSAVLYTLRCMIDDSDMPLNQGCLIPVHINVPPGCLLNPSSQAAVVGGNVLTSQRITDVIFKAFEICAASQGCMNNLTFGSDKNGNEGVKGSSGPSFGYYETIGGGAGAGPGWHGASGVHTHMTNTRITDPEILERRYPIILQKFGFRSGTGGNGQWEGGMGLERVLYFRRHLTVSILSERRALQPYGLNGGGPGARGINLLYMKEIDRTVNLGGKNTVNVIPGDVLYILTPGGGGYGAVEETMGDTVHIDGTEVEEGGVLWLRTRA